MLSVFHSQEFRFGFRNLTKEEMVRINLYRRGTKYVDEDAAVTVNNTPEKPDLRHLLSMWSLLEYGVSKEGYWTYDRMSLQLEDCIDVLKVIYPQYSYVFYLTTCAVMIVNVRMD
jgi:hypothetical protein